MNKEEMIGVLAVKTGKTRKEVKEVLDCFLDTIAECLRRDEQVSLYAFGNFVATEQAARRAFDFGVGEVVKRPPSKIAKFRPSPCLLQDE